MNQQILCLITYLPLILEDIVEKNSNICFQWNVILMLVEILKIVIAPTMNKIIILYLEELIATHQ